MRLNPGPAVSVVHFRLVQNLVEHPLRIAIGVVRGQRAPQRGETLHCIVAVAKPLLVLIAGMHIDLDRQAVGQHGIDGAVQARHKIAIQPVGRARITLQRRRIDAQPHVIEAQTRHQRNVHGVRVTVGVRSRIIARLREPLRSIDAMPQMSRARKRGGNTGTIGTSEILRRRRSRQHHHHCHQANRKTHPHPP